MLIGVLAVLLFAGAVGFGVYRADQQQHDKLAIPANATATGVPVGPEAAPVTVDLYVDFQCPACRAYELRSGATLDELVASGIVRVIYHPVAFLDRISSGYSTRASAASGCAAHAGVFSQYAKLLFAYQPPEGGTGLSADQLIALGQQAGAGAGFAECVTANTYRPWAEALTDEASKAGVNGTPTVKVNGQEIDNTDAALRAAVQAAQSSR